MDQWRKSLREEKFPSGTKSPSFSSSLLDAIYRSFDETDHHPHHHHHHHHHQRELPEEQESSLYREAMKKKQSISISSSSSKNNSNSNSIRGGGGGEGGEEVKEIASQRRVCLIDKWMEKKATEKIVNSIRRKSVPDFDRIKVLDDYRSSSMLFHSTSSSSDSSSGGGFSSSDAESVYGSRTTRSSSSVVRPKPVRTSVSVRPERYMNREIHENERNLPKTKTKNENGIFKTKSKAMKIYGDLLKVKPPISPGGKIASFLNSLFTPKKSSKISSTTVGGGEEFVSSEIKSKSSAQTSTCSSASSFSRSCLSKAPSSNNGKLSNGIKRSVRFYPVSVIVDEDSRPCGEKSLHEDKPNLMSLNKELNFHLKEKKLMNQQSRVEEVAIDLIKNYHRMNSSKVRDYHVVDQDDRDHEADDDDEEDEDDDGASYASSDLFELDSLSAIGIDRFREELPVYETTHFETNRAIAKGFIL